MSRLSAVLLLGAALLLVQARAQGPATPLWPTEVIGESSGSFTLSVRVVGKADVRFHNLGTIPSSLNSGDAVSELTRVYHDGLVGRDQRTTSDGFDLPDDGLTNNWSMLLDSQVLADRSGIAFHNYSTVTDGSTVDANSGSKPGVDMELSRRFGGYGKRMQDNRRTGSWGGFIGFGVTDVNAKSSNSIAASLHTITDLYSLDGAVPPTAPYSAPSTETVTIIGADGTETSVILNNTTLLANRPFSRQETTEAGAAAIDGFWQVRGTYASLRAGLWTRWHLSRQLSFRASVGATFSYLGLQMRYDEMLSAENLLAEIREQDRTEADPYNIAGYFASLDVEFWLTRRTGLFASFMVEDVSKDIELTVGGRTAEVGLSSGTGFRFGITTLF